MLYTKRILKNFKFRKYLSYFFEIYDTGMKSAAGEKNVLTEVLKLKEILTILIIIT